MKRNFVFLLIAFGFCSAVHADEKPQNPDAASIVKQFYEFHFAHDMGFTPDAVKQRSNWLTPEMIEACRAYFAMPQNPDEPPIINGDPFTGTQEYPQSFSVGDTKAAKDATRVDVTFHWKEAPSRKAVVVLKSINNKWVIDDIEFPDQTSMRALLKP